MARTWQIKNFTSPLKKLKCCNLNITYLFGLEFDVETKLRSGGQRSNFRRLKQEIESFFNQEIKLFCQFSGDQKLK
jgi:hypothetical protein